jgi:predicted ATPase/DNA-binding winged helix-turn-helix (wHTH) protein
MAAYPPDDARTGPATQPGEMPADAAAADSRQTRLVSFGPFQLIPARQLLLEGQNPVRIGSRALEILIALTERAGEVVSKDSLMARVWPDAPGNENLLRVSITGLRKALGDGRPGRRYLANVAGRGYRFVAPIQLSDLESPPNQPETAGPNHNLPISKPPIVGRARVVETLCRQLSLQRLVTIVGPGGIGKTAVALAVAEALLSAYPDGVRFVDLASIDDPGLISSALATALGRAVRSDSATPCPAESLRHKRMLIVLDGCERVAAAAAGTAERLLTVAAGVSILATGREPLRADGERVFRLPPLDFPIDSTGLTAAAALEFPAVQLFVDRAAAVLNGFELKESDASSVCDICRKLDGIALAIEFAAARIDVFGVRQLAVLLDDPLHILNLGKRTAAPRHQSLTASLDWSYAFLPEREQHALCRLSVFPGMFDLAAAVFVAGDGDADIVDAIANLVSKSLVSVEMGGATILYRLLDTTRAYALQKLTASGELEKYTQLYAQQQRADANPGTSINGEANGHGIRGEDPHRRLDWALHLPVKRRQD